MMKKIAVFPGSFDPFTRAHEDLVLRALPLFDEIVIAIGVNTSKQGLLPFEVREEAIKAVFKDEAKVQVRRIQGLTVNFCREVGAQFMLRGLRNGIDLEFENAIAQNNLILAPEVESLFLLARSGLGHISSTIVRDILRNGGDVSALVPEAILPFLKTAE
ncbi:pantetheine-phosphate adenylyltransferase [Sphingobacterium corticibacter]|uniref:Phosphopantetheine adenylyltransferase n=1 Tax=Sphingobacterium corticibacter TaxID=2171749 RepID=A0A2T8HI38_9SPHI|nr:pantetheine-phosphate adenylyltransferase [Sphingobacterium corticibacter]PVH25060.1 pantetheine-phosphate adenylyltransferase [Sphingobacterium corticibacter]